MSQPDTPRRIALCRLWQKGESVSVLARKVGVTPATMRRWIMDARLVIAVRQVERKARRAKEIANA